MNPYPALRTNDFFKIHIEHLPTKKKVAFEGWVTNFSDTYTSQWQEEMVYGRMDPLATYQNTRRSITLGFDIPNDDQQHSIGNMAKVRQLIKFMYPLYEKGALSQQNTVQAGPILALKWTNLISSPNNAGEKLIGYINGGLSYTPEVAEGGFIMGPLASGLGTEHHTFASVKNYFPKKLSLSFTFTVLHTHLVGWAPAAGAVGGNSFTFGGSQAIQEGFPNAFTAPPPPNPESNGADSTILNTTENANENLDPDNTPTEEEIEDAIAERRDALNRADDTAASQNTLTGASDETPHEEDCVDLERDALGRLRRC